MNISTKVGVCIVTYNRPGFLRGLLQSLEKCQDTIDELVVVNDGDIIPDLTLFKGVIINNEVNLGVAKNKNKGIQYLLDNNCDYIFVIEDDMVILDKDIFTKYINTHKATGIHHFNYGPGSPFNRYQTIQNFDLHNRHLLDQHSEPNPKLVVDYGNNIKVSLFEHTVAMFTFYTRECLEKVGLIDEEFDQCWEHISHTQKIINVNMHPPFWWFADIFDSHKYLTEAEGAIENSSIAKDRSKWMEKVYAGREIYKGKHGWYPNESPITSKEGVVEIMKNMHK